MSIFRKYCVVAVLITLLFPFVYFHTAHATVKGYQLRKLEQLPNGNYDRITFMASSKDRKLISENLKELEQSSNQRSKFIGVIAIYGELQGKNVMRISNDPNIFVADITSQYLKDELLKNKQIQEKIYNEKYEIDVNVPNLYWELEDAGIIQYESPYQVKPVKQ